MKLKNIKLKKKLFPKISALLFITPHLALSFFLPFPLSLLISPPLFLSLLSPPPYLLLLSQFCMRRSKNRDNEKVYFSLTCCRKSRDCIICTSAIIRRSHTHTFSQFSKYILSKEVYTLGSGCKINIFLF